MEGREEIGEAPGHGTKFQIPMAKLQINLKTKMTKNKHLSACGHAQAGGIEIIMDIWLLMFGIYLSFGICHLKFYSCSFA